ncbi:peptidoglycan-binding protein [Oscillatoriales cyanobacterium LEGE 11467]|uniref:Peptidoglycan-binding protein n=1 Tax=Zarconia navalis LEGE 11467 TaxID=1828826 RepID=A0A928Z926_9CYAN|nr:GH25 family lysozyme [Zarconia navalis]MBE9040391.1 peptidoglycan-binding protein [Zarconia navalis LEGE 11467]
MSVRGIDISDAQRKINWQTVANSGFAYAVTQATLGNQEIADSFPSHWEAIAAVDLVRGAYHVFSPDVDAAEQAAFFLNTVSLKSGDLPPVLYVPISGGDRETLETRLQTWLDTIEGAIGRKSILYTSLEVAQLLPESFAKYPLWIASEILASQPELPPTWKNWTFWRYTQKGRVPGIEGGVNISWFQSIHEGEKGDRIEDLQQRLKDWGLDPGNIDGTFAPLTQAAVVEFQRWKDSLEDGVVGPQTWAYLSEPATPISTPESYATSSSDSISLLNVARYYQGVPEQIQALDWLQGQMSDEQLQEFAKLWRNESTNATSPIRLVNAAVYYQGATQQDTGWNWLQNEISPPILAEFASKWRSAPPPAISMVDVARYYRGLPAQASALNWLQSQMSASGMREFARLWRNQPTTSSTSIRLIDTATYYKGAAHQNKALSWLQRHISAATLDEFSRRWRSAPPLPLRLVNVAEYYKGVSHQNAALTWLQAQVSETTFEEFCRRWRA